MGLRAQWPRGPGAGRRLLWGQMRLSLGMRGERGLVRLPRERSIPPEPAWGVDWPAPWERGCYPL